MGSTHPIFDGILATMSGDARRRAEQELKDMAERKPPTPEELEAERQRGILREQVRGGA